MEFRLVNKEDGVIIVVLSKIEIEKNIDNFLFTC